MKIVIPILICFLPLLIVYVSFAGFKEDFKKLNGLVACILGLVAVAPIALIQFILNRQTFFYASTLASVLIESLLINGFIEETVKMIFLIPLGSNKLNISNFLECSILSGLSLGCFESIIYLISGYMNICERMVTAVIIHTVCAALSGLFVYGLKNKVFYILPFIYAIVIHGLYDYFAIFDTKIKFFSFAVILFGLIEVPLRYRSLKEKLNGTVEKIEA